MNRGKITKYSGKDQDLDFIDDWGEEPTGAYYPVLDHGFVRPVEAWGTGDRGEYAREHGLDFECGIIEAARQSTQGSFRGWDKDAKLLKYLYENSHSTPFEFAGMVIEVRAPIFVFREWMRHRTQCLAPGTMIHFDAPKSKTIGCRSVQKQPIEKLWRQWQPTTRSARPERQVNPFYKRSLVKQQLLRNLNEATGEIEEGRIVDVMQGQPKHMMEIETETGRRITTSADHRFFTNEGWLSLKDIKSRDVGLAVETTKRYNEVRKPFQLLGNLIWKPVIGYEKRYSISSHGRVRNELTGKVLTNTINKQSYDVVSLTINSQSMTHSIHVLVCSAFHGKQLLDYECCHKDHNRANNQPQNIVWGSSQHNSDGMIKADRQQRLVTGFEAIEEIKTIGIQPSYDLSVMGVGHNFIANGFVVHNSYNEMSARYAPLPDLNYLPTVDRILKTSSNKQAGAATEAKQVTRRAAEEFIAFREAEYAKWQTEYERALHDGVPKEIARIGMPVGRYSQMRASTSLRNWLAFLTLRMDPAAQEEIRLYAEAVGKIISERFPQTWRLFCDNRK